MASKEDVTQQYNHIFGNGVERFSLKNVSSNVNTEIFISRIDHQVTARELLLECIKYGNVADLRLIRYPSESLAFVRYSSTTDLNNALASLNGVKLQQHKLKAVRSNDIKIVDLNAPNMQLDDITQLLINTVYGEAIVDTLPEVFHYKISFTTHDAASSFRYAVNNSLIKGFTIACQCAWISHSSEENLPATRKRKVSDLTQEEIKETQDYILQTAIDEYRKLHDGNIPSKEDNVDLVREFHDIDIRPFLPAMKKAPTRVILEQQRQKLEAFLTAELPKKNIEDYRKLLQYVLEMIITFSDSFKNLADSFEDVKGRISKFMED